MYQPTLCKGISKTCFLACALWILKSAKYLHVADVEFTMLVSDEVTGTLLSARGALGRSNSNISTDTLPVAF
jgi:hypothetical protein